MLFKYCGIIGLLVNIPITICITVIPPLPSPPGSTPLPCPMASFFSGVRIRLGTILGRFSIIYFRGLGLRIMVRVWVGVRVRVRVWVGVRVRVRVSVVLWSG